MSQHTLHTLGILAEVFSQRKRTVVLVSGGKDSLTLLHCVRPWRDLVTVLHLHEPDGWPDVTSNLITNMNEWGFLRSQQIEPQLSFEAYVEEFGWPVDVVPTALDGATTRPLSPFYTGGVKLASWWHCSLYRHLIPIGWALASLEAEIVLSGTRYGDAPGFAAQGAKWTKTQGDGLWERIDPIHHWSVAQVYEYIDENGITLPEYYRVKRHSDGWEWHDCLSCTWQPEHWAMLKDFYPEEYAKRWPAAKEVFEALKEQMTNLQNQLEVLE